MTRIHLVWYGMMYRVMGATAIAVALTMLTGCVKFASSASFSSSVSLVSSSISSDVLSSPFRSSFRSSGEQEKEQEQEQIQEEIEIYTALWLSSETLAEGDLQVALATITARYGVSDWAAYPSVWLGLGRGLAAAGLSADMARRYALSWAGGDVDLTTLLARGYDAAIRDKTEGVVSRA